MLKVLVASLFSVFFLIGCSGAGSSGGSADSGSGDSGGGSPSCSTSDVTSASSLANSESVDGQSVVANSNYAYVGTTSGNTGIQVVDISNSSSLVNKGYFPTYTGSGKVDATGNDVLDMALSGNTLYATTLNGALISVDVSNPNSPSYLDSLDLAGSTWSVVLNGTTAYVGSTSIGLVVVDVSTPSSMTQTTLNTNYKLIDMQIDSNILYGTDGQIVYVLDVSNPMSISLLGSHDLGSSYAAYEIHRNGNYIYAVDKSANVLRTLDISDLGSISVVNTSAAGALDFRTIDGNSTHLFVGTGASSSGEVRVYDLATPAAPSLIKTVAATQRVYELHVLSNKLVTANRGSNTEVFSLCQ